MKIRYWIISIVILFFSCVYLFYYFYESEREREIQEIVGHQKIHAKLAARNFSELFEKWNSVLFYLSKDPSVIDMDNNGKIELENLRNILKKEINGITRVNKDGIITFSTPFYPNTIGRDISQQKHMIKILNDHLPVVSDVFEAVQGYQAIVIHYPVFKNNKFEGTIAFLLNFRQIASRILDVTTSGKSATIMVSGDGIELYSSIKGEIGKNINELVERGSDFRTVVDSMLDGKEGSLTFESNSIKGVNSDSKKIAYYIPVIIDHSFWSLVLIYSEDDITASLYSFRNKLILIFVLIFLGGIIISYFGIKALIIVKETDVKKKAEKELQKSEERYRLISSVASDYMFSTSLSKNGSLLLDWVSGAFESITEYTYEEYIQIGGWRAALYPDDREQDERDIATLQNNQHVITEVRTITKTGKIIWVRVYAHPIWDEKEGKLIGIYGAVQNITERKNAEEELKKSEDRFRTIYNSVNDAIIIHNLETGDILDVNATTEKMYGYSKDEMLNLSINDISLGITPYTKKEAMECISSAKDGIKNSFEWMAKHKSGKIFWVEVNMNQVNLGGKERILAMIRDISERKAVEEKLTSSEARYRFLFEHNPAPMLIYERETNNILAANEAFQLYYGYRTDEILKMSLPDIYPENEKAKIVEITSKLHGYKNVGEWHHIKRDGSVITIIAKSHDINFENKSARVAVMTDISDLKRAEKVLIEAKENAEKSEKLKSDFLAQMSHEIRSPINNLLNFTQLIRETLDPRIVEEQLESFNAVEQAGSRIVRTIDLILNMAELQTGNYECRFEELCINDILNEIYNEYKFKAERKKIELLYSKINEKLKITGDEYSVMQIFVNLVDNAIKYTNVGKVEIVILKTQDNKVEVKIVDSGIGISKEYIGNLFTPFSQEEQGYTRRFEGNGLGLALVKRYCEMNKAEITVESMKGEGSTFKVVFS